MIGEDGRESMIGEDGRESTRLEDIIENHIYVNPIEL